MPSHHQYDFQRLPERIQRRIAKSVTEAQGCLQQEALNNTLFYIVYGAGLVVLLSVLAILLIGPFGKPGVDSLWSNRAIMVLYGLLVGGMAGLAVAIRNRYTLNRMFGFMPGQYMFPFTLIDARKATMTIVDLTFLKGIEVTHHKISGNYSHTTFAFSFNDAPTRVWKISNALRAEQFGVRLTQLQAEARHAFEQDDVATLLRLDPFFEIRRKQWEAQVADSDERGWLGQRLAQPVLAGVAAALLLAPLVWTARNAGADFAMHANAQRLRTEAAYQAYIDHGLFYVGEMRGQIPAIAFEEVRKQRSVTALRALLQRYPQGGLQADAGREIHALYQNALDKFSAQAVTRDAALLAAMGQMLEVLEKRGDPRVGVRFARPTTDALTALDARIKSKEATLAGKTIIPVAEHFQANSAAAREARIVKELQAGFALIFPNDVLAFEGVGPTDTRLPVLTIDYQIEPSGAVYVLDGTERAFVGLVARFQSGIRTKESGQPWRFNMEVEPPEQFQVKQQQSGELSYGPADSQVYAVMAERAFDALSDKLRASFFRPDSAAFNSMKRAPAP